MNAKWNAEFHWNAEFRINLKAALVQVVYFSKLLIMCLYRVYKKNLNKPKIALQLCKAP